MPDRGLPSLRAGRAARVPSVPVKHHSLQLVYAPGQTVVATHMHRRVIVSLRITG